MKENKNDFEFLKERIYFYLNEKNITINRLAEKSGLRQSTISSFLNRKSMPRLDTIIAICKGLNISVTEFFDFPPFNEKQKN